MEASFQGEKNDYYAILVRGSPKERPKDCIIELYVTDKELTISEIKYNAEHEQIELLSRQIVSGKLLPVKGINKAVEEMKDTAERRENKNLGTSLSSAYSSKYNK